MIPLNVEKSMHNEHVPNTLRIVKDGPTFAAGVPWVSDNALCFWKVIEEDEQIFIQRVQDYIESMVGHAQQFKTHLPLILMDLKNGLFKSGVDLIIGTSAEFVEKCKAFVERPIETKIKVTKVIR